MLPRCRRAAGLYDEFMEAIKNGTKDDTFGFVLANSGANCFWTS